jgi:hypothetical protein
MTEPNTNIFFPDPCPSVAGLPEATFQQQVFLFLFLSLSVKLLVVLFLPDLLLSLFFLALLRFFCSSIFFSSFSFPPALSFCSLLASLFLPAVWLPGVHFFFASTCLCSSFLLSSCLFALLLCRFYFSNGCHCQ